MAPSRLHPAARWSTLTRAERDAAYNNNLACPDSPRLIQERNSLAAAYRAARPGALDVPYGDGARQAWDLFPGNDPAAPCLVFLHGGYWQMNGRETFAHMAAGVAAHGWSAALPSHTLAPDANLGTIVGEIHQALDWLALNGPDHGIAGKIILAGWSAGAQLASLMLAHPAVAAGLAISGVFELGPLRDTYLNQKLQLDETEVEQLSPLRLDVVGKPLAIAYGSRELPALVEDSRSFHAKRAAAHAPGALLPVSGADHFSILAELHSAGGQLTQAVLSLAKD